MEESSSPYFQVFVQTLDLAVDYPGAKGRRKSFSLNMPSLVVHLREEGAPAQGLEPFVLPRRLWPVAVSDLGDHGGISHVDGARQRAVPRLEDGAMDIMPTSPLRKCCRLAFFDVQHVLAEALGRFKLRTEDRSLTFS